MEYATRDQAQHAVNTLSNQNLMGRLVYVREVSSKSSQKKIKSLNRVGHGEEESNEVLHVLIGSRT